jgi:gluconate 2-dehydrogenase gamma chain
MDRIVPPDADPGAWDSGVGDYLARQFQGDLRDQLYHYQLGLDSLEAEALATAGSSFSALAPEAQDTLLRRVEAGQVQHLWPIDPARFFSAVVGHVIEGYYSDPGNGGNRGRAAWRMIGYVFPTGP